jgi:hypothetical protein
MLSSWLNDGAFQVSSTTQMFDNLPISLFVNKKVKELYLSMLSLRGRHKKFTCKSYRPIEIITYSKCHINGFTSAMCNIALAGIAQKENIPIMWHTCYACVQCPLPLLQANIMIFGKRLLHSLLNRSHKNIIYNVRFQ